MSSHVKTPLIIVTAIALATGCSVSPKKLTEQEVMNNSAQNIKQLEEQASPVTHPISLEEAFARAVKHNRDNQLKVFEALLQQQQLEVDQFDMLPELAAEAGYTYRNNYAASASVTFSGGEPDDLPSNPSYSVSSDKSSVNSSISATWDVLDFGLSYFRAKQQSDRFLIAKERERKVVNNIMQDVRRAYYRAATAQRLLKKIDPLLEKSHTALKDAAQIEALRAGSPMQALTYQKQVLDTIRTLQELKTELRPAKAELATLMGIKPGEDFTLTDVEKPDFSVPSLEFDLEEIERTALVKRPELIEMQYNERITQAEVRSAFLMLFPSINLSAGYYANDSEYQKYNDWTSVGVGLNLNLMNYFRYGSIQKLNDLKVAVAKQQTLAISMTIISQIHMANMEYQESKSTYDFAKQYYSVSQRIKKQVLANSQAQSIGELQLIQEQLNEVLAEVRRDKAHSDVQQSFGRVLSSIGFDPLPEGFGGMDLNQLANAFKVKQQEWFAGDFDTVTLQEMKEAEAAKPKEEPKAWYQFWL